MSDKDTENINQAAEMAKPAKKKANGALIGIIVLALLLSASVGANVYLGLDRMNHEQTDCEVKPVEPEAAKPEAEKPETDNSGDSSADDDALRPAPEEAKNLGFRRDAILSEAAVGKLAYDGPSVSDLSMSAVYRAEQDVIELSYSKSVYLHRQPYDGILDGKATLRSSEPIYALNVVSYGQAFDLEGIGILATFKGGRIGMLTMDEILNKGMVEFKPMPGVEGVVALTGVGVGPKGGQGGGWHSVAAVTADGSFYDVFEQKR